MINEINFYFERRPFPLLLNFETAQNPQLPQNTSLNQTREMSSSSGKIKISYLKINILFCGMLLH